LLSHAALPPLYREQTQAVDSMSVNVDDQQIQSVVDRLSKQDYVPPPPEPAVQTVECSVPPVDTSFKSYTDYRCITDRTSPQWAVREQCFTDEDGMRRIEAPNGEIDYIVALGSAYTTTVGDRFIFTLDTGATFTATVGDLKQDRHTDPSHRYIERDGNVAEFHIDSEAVSARVLQMGDVSWVDGLSGQIVRIQKIL
jgi:hypothetical protein